MNEFDTVQLVALVGWLILAVGALASYRLNWKTGIKLVLIWSCIFTAVALFISVVQ